MLDLKVLSGFISPKLLYGFCFPILLFLNALRIFKIIFKCLKWIFENKPLNNFKEFFKRFLAQNYSNSLRNQFKCLHISFYVLNTFSFIGLNILGIKILKFKYLIKF